MKIDRKAAALAAASLTSVAFAALAPSDAAARLEAKMYAITVWNAGCAGGQRDAWDDMVDAWYDEVTNAGVEVFGWCLWGHCGEAYSRDGRLVNSTIRNSYFADAAVVAWGGDSTRLDEGDAVMIGTHGFDGAGNDYGGTMRIDEAGAGDCNMMRSEMRLGNQDLEFLHLSSCNSMDANQWGAWLGATRGVHQVDGFHGFMWIGGGLVSNYSNFADDAFDGSIAMAWLDNHYVPDVSGTDDQCPVAYSVGTSASDAINRLLTERYDNVLTDVANPTWWAATYWIGCDPQNESAM